MALLLLTAASAAFAAFAGRSPLLAVATAVIATAAAILVPRGTGGALIAAVLATVLAAGAWTAAEARTRHVLIPWLVVLAIFAALLILRQRTDERSVPAASTAASSTDSIQSDDAT
jgi:hypothetical protein